MNQDRRRAERVKVNLPARWECAMAGERGTVSDISTSGCFLLTSGAATPGEPVHIALELPQGDAIRLSGEVVYYTDEIGFAVRFKGVNGKKKLSDFLKPMLTGVIVPPPAKA